MASDDIDATVVRGQPQTPERRGKTLVSNASCTTNRLRGAAVGDAQRDGGSSYGLITTIHSAMNDQPVIDAYHHEDPRAHALGLPVGDPVRPGSGYRAPDPELEADRQAKAIRVPTVNVSVVDLTVRWRDTSAAGDQPRR